MVEFIKAGDYESLERQVIPAIIAITEMILMIAQINCSKVLARAFMGSLCYCFEALMMTAEHLPHLTITFRCYALD